MIGLAITFWTAAKAAIGGAPSTAGQPIGLLLTLTKAS